jgi:SHS2 domain-containing protein
MATCMFNYITDIEKVEIDPEKVIELSAKGHDMHSLLFAFMDEFLYLFASEGFCVKKAKILDFDRNLFEIKVQWYENLILDDH